MKTIIPSTKISTCENNVLAVIGDQKLRVLQGGVVVSFEAHVISSQDYSPFGVTLPGRSWSEGYRYGFNGMEKDNEVKGKRNWQDYGLRMYDPRLARFPNIDPLTKEYPELSTFQFASNTPIWAIDLDGAEALVIQASVRATCLLVTVSIGVSLAFTSTSVSFYVTPEVGLGTGVSLAAGVSFAIYPNATSSEQFAEWGMNIGASVMGNGGDFSAGISGAGVGAAGGGMAVPKLGGGAGAEAHISFGYSFLITTVKYEDALSALYDNAQALGLTKYEATNLYNKGKKAFEDSFKKEGRKEVSSKEPERKKEDVKTPQSPNKKNGSSKQSKNSSDELRKRFEDQPEMRKVIEERKSNTGIG